MTGARGVVGRFAVPRLVARGYAVTAVGRTAQAREDLRRMGANPIALDLFDEAAARRAMEGHEAVVNLATHMPSSMLKMFLPGAWKVVERIKRIA